MIPGDGWWAQFRGADGRLDPDEEAPLVCWIADEDGLPVGVVADDFGVSRCDELVNFAGYVRRPPYVAAIDSGHGGALVVDADGGVDVRP